MRSWLASLTICLCATPSLAGDASKLPDFFTQSFDAVSAQPLQAMAPAEKPAAAAEVAAVPASPPVDAAMRAEETGAIAHDVPTPPRRPGEPAAAPVVKVAAPAAKIVAPVAAKPAAPAAVKPAATAAAKPAAPAEPMVVAAASSVGSAPPPLGAAFSLAVPASVRIKSPLSFTFGGRSYDLVSTDGLNVRTECTKEANGRCIVHPMRNLKEAIAGQTLQCRPAGDGPNARVACQR
jgi:hypothetical protein